VPEFGRAVVVSCPVVDGLLGLLMFGLLEVVELFGLLEVLGLFGLFRFELLLLSLTPVLLLWPAVAFESVGLGLLGLIEELGVVVVVVLELIELLSVRFIPLVAEPLLAELSTTGPRMEVSRAIPLFIRFMLVSEPIAAPALPVR